MDDEYIITAVTSALSRQPYIVGIEDLGPSPEAARFLLRYFTDRKPDPQEVSEAIEDYFRRGTIGAPSRAEWLAVLYSHPEVADFNRAAAYLDEVEALVLIPGRFQMHHLPQQLSAIRRHRGVIDHLQRRFEQALEHFLKAFDLHPVAVNGQNLLCVLTGMDRLHMAVKVFDLLTASSPAMAAEIDDRSRHDLDLLPLRAALSSRLAPTAEDQRASQVEAFRVLLASLFNELELRQWLRSLPDGQVPVDALPIAPVSFNGLIFEAVEVLNRHGRIHLTLFASLIRARPNKAAEIEAVRARWVGKG